MPLDFFQLPALLSVGAFSFCEGFFFVADKITQAETQQQNCIRNIAAVIRGAPLHRALSAGLPPTTLALEERFTSPKDAANSPLHPPLDILI